MILLLNDLKGVGRSSSIVVTEGGVRLPDEPARLVMLSNWNVENEPTFTLKAAPGLIIEEQLNEVYWGFNGVYAHQLFPGKDSEWMPIANLQQISLRSRPGETAQIWFSWLV